VKAEARAILYAAIVEGLDHAAHLRLRDEADIAATILDAIERREAVAVYMRRAPVPPRPR
jgi:hypothetical protein